MIDVMLVLDDLRRVASRPLGRWIMNNEPRIKAILVSVRDRPSMKKARRVTSPKAGGRKPSTPDARVEEGLLRGDMVDLWVLPHDATAEADAYKSPGALQVLRITASAIEAKSEMSGKVVSIERDPTSFTGWSVGFASGTVPLYRLVKAGTSVLVRAPAKPARKKKLPDVPVSTAQVPNVDPVVWDAYRKAGAQLAKKLCAGKVKMYGTGGAFKMNVRTSELSFEVGGTLVGGPFNGVKYISNGHIAIPCDEYPPVYTDADIAAVADGFKRTDWPEVQLMTLPPLDTYTPQKIAALSNSTGVNPVYLAACVTAVGAPWVLRQSMKGRAGKEVNSPFGPLYVHGPNGVAIVMPMRMD